MEGNNFISKAIGIAVSDYIKSKNAPEGILYNSFFVVAIRELVAIYDELDIITPFQNNDENLLALNLGKYGYTVDKIKSFIEALDRYAVSSSNADFLLIQKMLVDMFVQKKITLDLTDEDISAFRGLIFSPYAVNPLIISYNFLMSDNPLEVVTYFDKEVSEKQKPVITKAKEMLNLGAYEILKYSLDDVKSMSADELDNVNKKVYEYFHISENAINKKYLLDKAVYDFNNPKASYSTGNGYVDILFFMGVLSTITLIIIVLTIFFA